MNNLRIKIERAEKHISELKEEIRSYFQKNPINTSVQWHPEANLYVTYIRPPSAIPTQFAAIIGDIAANLRAPLDHAFVQAVQFEMATVRRTFNIQFPIAKDSASLRELVKKWRLEQAPKAVELANSFKPFSGGNHLIHGLHELGKLDRHIELCGTAFIQRQYSGQWKVGPGGILHFYVPDTAWSHLTKDIPIASCTIADFEIDIRIPIDVCVTKPEIFKSKPITSTLEEIKDEVEKILSAFEALLSEKT